ncbi:MAG: glycoside hydrolase family 2 [Planctomycetota bacterium]|nr:glycoside hydrolase family 2 [Planctomycetota bacterium]
MTIPRPEHPRPDLERPDWLNLNGEWQFAFDDDDAGLASWWQVGHDLPLRINVPFAYQTPLSGINTRDFHHVIWYRRTFEVPAGWFGRRVRLNFGAVDYSCAVYVNGKLAGTHSGGHTPFALDITRLLSLDNRNEVVLRVYDDERLCQPRGKQHWHHASAGCHYTRTSGIWQTVWLEPLAATAIEHLHIRSWDLGGHVQVDVLLDKPDTTVRVRAEALCDGTVVAVAEGGVMSDRAEATAGRCVPLHLQIPSPRVWSVEHPHLYGLKLTVLRGTDPLETVHSYFGIRSLSTYGGAVMLNGHRLYQRLVLDQGYWPDGLLTAATDDELKADIVRMKDMGFNGCRKHQKLEDPRFLYWADKLGYLVWGEMANTFEYSDEAVCAFAAEWEAAVLRDRNHPCVVAWTPINESWGVNAGVIHERPEQIAFLNALYCLTHALDPSRPVNGNCGWQNPQTDLATVHDYTQQPAELKRHIETYVANPALNVANAPAMAQHLPGSPYRGQPILVTEYGGIGLLSGQNAWGYGNVAQNTDELLARYDALTGALQQVPECMGFCYTQLSDVEQEQNGLYTYDRKPKLDPAKVRAINERRR